MLRDPTTLPGEIRDLLERENAYAETVMAPTAALQKRLIKEMRGRMEDEDADVPVPDGPFEYYTRFREDGQHELFCRIPRGGGPEAILLDGDALAKGLEFFELGDCEPSARHDLLAWTADDKGSELYTIKVRDVATGRDRADSVTRSDGSVVWTADDTAFFYVRVDDNHRGSSVWLHRLGTDHQEDRAVYDEADPTWFVSVGRSRSGRFAIISIHGHDAAEARVVPLDAPETEPRLIAARSPGLRYELDHRGDRFIILTNADGAGRLQDRRGTGRNDPASAPCGGTSFPHRPGCRLIVGSPRRSRTASRPPRAARNGLPRIVVRHFEQRQSRPQISFPEEAYSARPRRGGRAETLRVMRFSYSSMTTPEEVYDYDMTRREHAGSANARTIPSGHDPAVLRDATHLRGRHTDGAEVPISVLLQARHPVLDGSAPLLLYGYGAYGYALPGGLRHQATVASSTAVSSTRSRMSGAGPTRAGPGTRTASSTNKTNTFSDFIAAGRGVVPKRASRLAGPDRGPGGQRRRIGDGSGCECGTGSLCRHRGRRPLRRCAEHDPRRSIATDPARMARVGQSHTGQGDAFDTIRGYSPYDNVARHSAIRRSSRSGRPHRPTGHLLGTGEVGRAIAGQCPCRRLSCLLKTNMEAGHGGASGRYEQLDEVGLHLRVRAGGCTGSHARQPEAGTTCTVEHGIA